MVEMTKKESPGTSSLFKKILDYVGQNNDLVNPIINHITSRLYPYVIIFGILFALLFVMVLAILCILIQQMRLSAYVMPAVNTAVLVE